MISKRLTKDFQNLLVSADNIAMHADNTKRRAKELDDQDDRNPCSTLVFEEQHQHGGRTGISHSGSRARP